MEGNTLIRVSHHSADWYSNDVFDATAEELCAIEYICSFFPVWRAEPEISSEEMSDAGGSSGDGAREPGRSSTTTTNTTTTTKKCIWLVNEMKEPVLRMSNLHPLYDLLMFRTDDEPGDEPGGDDDGSTPDLSGEVDLSNPQYSPERMRQMILTVRGDGDLERDSRAWWSCRGNPPANARLVRCHGPPAESDQ
ncbi:hypothetical protein PV08_06513 [Exophiala spinifera]|uniref:Uncharacterized protein n=1 Tax=Exophiala spinifera TaxID=91928 RepID=A0A0D2BYS6_9EURO|nr:uncharacterized protein PV08_06513 [Exophiala spinifera]KIW16459.1 hypothetical protein PV08_06513 [Exophiala spinifera]